MVEVRECHSGSHEAVTLGLQVNQERVRQGISSAKEVTWKCVEGWTVLSESKEAHEEEDTSGSSAQPDVSSIGLILEV